MTKGSTWSILCCRLMHVPHTGCNVRFGSKADMYDAKRHVRFTPKSGHVQCNSECPLSANSGHPGVLFDNLVAPSDSPFHPVCLVVRPETREG